MNTEKARRSGFTIIELLVVITIISVLLTVLLPSLSLARESGMRLKCASNLRGISRMIITYAQDNKNVMPFLDLSHFYFQWRDSVYLDTMLQQYGGVVWPVSGGPNIMNSCITLCPSAPAWRGSNNWWDFDSRYTYFASNIGNYGMDPISAESTRPFPLLRIDHLENLQNWAGSGRPAILAMDHVNFYISPYAGSYAQYKPYFSNHLDGNGALTGGNVTFLDGSANYFGWNGGSGWYTDGHSRPYDSCFHDSNPSGGSRISAGDGTGKLVVFNGSNNLDPSSGSFVAYNSFRSVYHY